MPKKLNVPVVRWPSWPAPDRDTWDAACRPGGVFDPCGGLSKYPTIRIRVFESAYGRWLGFLSLRVGGRAVVSGLDHLDDRDHVRAFLDMLNCSIASCSTRAYLTDLLTVARAMAPGRSFEVLHAATRFIWRTARPRTDKRSRIVPARDLFALGLGLMETAGGHRAAIKGAVMFRDGLMIAMLIECPVRRSNIASIAIGHHLVKLGSHYQLVFPRSEVKNRRPIEQRLSETLTPWIDCYLAVYRPILLKSRGRWWARDPGGALWISGHGTALKPSQVRDRVVMRTKPRFGLSITPHLFRDVAATTIAIEDPAHVEIIRDVLGHANHGTAERYYNQATGLDAARSYQNALDPFLNDR